MTRIELLEQLRAETILATGDMLLPVKSQKGDASPESRTADVFCMRLPDSKAAQKKAPYILHQLITAKDDQVPGQRPSSVAVLRSIFCVYNDDEQEGAWMLLNLMERLRIQLLKKEVIAKRFQLDLKDGMEALIYPDDTSPFFAGEMVSRWILPAIEREV